MEEIKKKTQGGLSFLNEKIHKVDRILVNKIEQDSSKKIKSNSRKNPSIQKQNRWLIIGGTCGLAVLLVVAGIYGNNQKSVEEAKQAQEAAAYQKMVEEELGREYNIVIGDMDIVNDTATSKNLAEVTVSCGLKEKQSEQSEEYIGQKSQLICSSNKLTGEFSNFNGVELSLTDGSASSLAAKLKNDDDGKFTINLEYKPIEANTWEHSSEINFEEIEKELSITPVLALYNNRINRTVLSSQVKITVELSDNDRNLLSSKKNAYNNHVAELEAKAKAEEEAKAKAEKAAAAKKATEEAAKNKKATNNSNSESKNNKKSSGSSSNTKASDNSGTSGSGTSVSGYCRDGTYVTGDPHAKGRANVCYGHGGWVINH